MKLNLTTRRELQRPLAPSEMDSNFEMIENAINENAGGGGSHPQIIDMKPGEYLSDIIQSITDATIDKQYTINFYNYSKTVNWDTFTEKIHVPRFVHINFVGNIDWWPNVYYPRMGFDEGLTDNNPIDKLFIGFSFDRTNDDYVTRISGLPTNLWKIFFGGLDSSYNEASEYQDLINDPDDWGLGTLGLVRVNGSKDDDSRNDALYKKINGVFVDVTPDFRACDFSGCNLNNAYFYSANNQGTNFNSANNQGAYFYSANNQGANFGYANNQGTNFNSANNQGTNFYSANNQGAYFNSANNQEVIFSYATNQGAIFDYANNQGASFSYANNQDASFSYANLRDVNWLNVVSIANANFQNADLTGGFNLPERINTKAKWIAECGAGNVNAQTIWIDGTSILS